MIRDGIRPICNVHVVLYGPDGEIKEQRWSHNIVPTVGLNHIADQLSASPGEGAMSHMIIGTGTQSVAASVTGVDTRLDGNTLSGRTDSGAVVTYTASWAAGDGTGAITEAEIANAASSGTCLAYTTFSVVNKAAADTLAITWTLTLADDGA